MYWTEFMWAAHACGYWQGSEMTIPRRLFLSLGLSAAALAVLPRIARAQTFPARPVHIIVGFPPGGASDIAARILGQWLSERLGQPFIIDNRPGAAGNLGTETAVRAPADGYTLLLTGAFNPINAALYDKLSFDFARDIVPVAGVVRTSMVMVVNQTFTAKTVPEFIAYAKANPGKINFASGGVGGPIFVAGELFKMLSGVNMVHVPYRGEAPAITDLLGGQVQVMFPTLPAAIGHIKAGTLRALAVTTAIRSEALPDVPTVANFLPGYEASAWYGIGAPKNTPADVVATLNKEINAALADPKIKTRLADLGGSVMPGSSADFGSLIADESEKWAKVVKFSEAKPD